jgi:hypothetical protein
MIVQIGPVRDEIAFAQGLSAGQSGKVSESL